MTNERRADKTKKINMIDCCASYKIYFNIYSIFICKRTFKYILPFYIVTPTLVAPFIAQIPKKNSVKKTIHT